MGPKNPKDFIDYAGVRLRPAQVVFDHFEANTVSKKIHLSALNLSAHKKAVRFYGPKAEKQFIFNSNADEAPLANGLDCKANITFKATDLSPLKDRIIVTIDGEILEIPIYCQPARPVMKCDDHVDFGTLCANNKLATAYLTINNFGSRTGTFEIESRSDSILTFSPATGKVSSNRRMIVKVEFVTQKAVQIEEKFSMKFDGAIENSFQVRAHVVDAQLELWRPDAEDTAKPGERTLKVVNFGDVYFETDKMIFAILFNNSPEPTDYVATLLETLPGDRGGGDSSVSRDEKDSINLLSVIPNQGRLNPFQKIPILLKFCPRWTKASKGFQISSLSPPRQDYAVFLNFQKIGSPHSLEVPIVASAFSPAIVFEPSAALIDFTDSNDGGSVPVGESRTAQLVLRNKSKTLPLTFYIPRVAQFLIRPDRGILKPQASIKFAITFSPKQFGSFVLKQEFQVLGEVSDKHDPFSAIYSIIHREIINLKGLCKSVSTKPTPRAEGNFATFKDFDTLAKTNPIPFGSAQTKRKNGAATQDDVLIAFPNDQAGSIRPEQKIKKFATIFTRAPRHTYVDKDYELTFEEQKVKEAHERFYARYLGELCEIRNVFRCDAKNKKFQNELDLGMEPMSGIGPRKLKIEEIEEVDREMKAKKAKKANDSKSNFHPFSTSALQHSDSLKEAGFTSSEPQSMKERRDCAMTLTPSQLHQIQVSKASIDFGQVSIKSVCQEDLSFTNYLDSCVHVKLNLLDCPELRNTSPVQGVIGENSRVTIPVIFESETLGTFQRSINYIINARHHFHVTISAEVVPVTLDVSTRDLILKSTPGLSPDSGFRGFVTLKNVSNRNAEFQWQPVLQDGVIAFSIRPASGIILARCQLDCEVVFHASFFAPPQASFVCNVKDGFRFNFNVKAQFGNANVELLDNRIVFGNVPVNLSTTKKCLLYNSGPSHAYFYVEDPQPFKGLNISPGFGVIPVGGTTSLNVCIQPSGLMKFDTKTMISIRGQKSLDLRIGGSVAKPTLKIDVSSLKLGGVYLGSQKCMPFGVKNTSPCRTEITFLLMQYRDFEVEFLDTITPEDVSFNQSNRGLYRATIAPGYTLKAQLVLRPTEIASYDFILDTIVNEIRQPPPAPTPLQQNSDNDLDDSENRKSYRSSSSSIATNPKNLKTEHILTPRVVPIEVITPSRHVVATVLRQPLLVTPRTLEFVDDIHTEIGQKKCFTIKNTTPGALEYRLDFKELPNDATFKILVSDEMIPIIDFSGTANEEFVEELEPGQSKKFTIIFEPKTIGVTKCSVPIYVKDTCFEKLELTGEAKTSYLEISPSAVIFQAVPLSTKIQQKLTVIAHDFQVFGDIQVDTPLIECDDGSKQRPITVSFFSGGRLAPDKNIFDVCVTFSCDKPTSFASKLTFITPDNQQFSIPICGTADNSILTCYSFLGQNQGNYQIVCESGHQLRGTKMGREESVGGEAVLVPNTGSPRPNSYKSRGAGANGRPSTTATTTSFDVSMSSYEPSTEPVVTDAIEALAQEADSQDVTHRDGARNADQGDISPDDEILDTRLMGGHEGTSAANAANESRRPLTQISRALGTLLFPEIDSERGMFHGEVLITIEKWITLFGYPNGSYPVSIPRSMRSGCGRIEGGARSTENSASTNLKKDYKTVYEMISNLAGRPIPGIPSDAPLPASQVDRLKQLYYAHSTLITFIRCQGGCVAGIRPEFLLDHTDFTAFCEYMKSEGGEELITGIPPSERAPGVSARNPSLNVSDLWSNDSKTAEVEAIENEIYENLSKQSWLDLILQIVKVLVVSRVTPRSLKMQPRPSPLKGIFPSINPDPLSSNIYSISERILLTWLNFYYENFRRVVWEDCEETPAARWIVNFDLDLLDGLVLACVIGAFAPFTINMFFKVMYTNPENPEQCLHNALKIIAALNALGLEFDIQAIELTDPNPVTMLLLITFLYQKLPQYIPHETLLFEGVLQKPVSRQISLSNPSEKAICYTALLVGEDAGDFDVYLGNKMTLSGSSSSTGPPSTNHSSPMYISAKGQLKASVNYTARFVRPANAVLVFCGRRGMGYLGQTVVFNLASTETNVIALAPPIEVEAQCYDHVQIDIPVRNNISAKGGVFTISLDESSKRDRHIDVSVTRTQPGIYARIEKPKPKGSIRKGDGKRPKKSGLIPTKRDSDNGDSPKKKLNDVNIFPTDSTLLAFHVVEKEIDFSKTSEITLHFVPISLGKHDCQIKFSNPELGDFALSIQGEATLPKVVKVFKFDVRSKSVLNDRIWISMKNDTREAGLIAAGKIRMSATEAERRRIAGIENAGSIAQSALAALTTEKCADMPPTLSRETKFDITHNGQNDQFKIAPKLILNPLASKFSHGTDGSSMRPRSADEVVTYDPSLDPNYADDDENPGCWLPFEFKADTHVGMHQCDILLSSAHDTRLYSVEISVLPLATRCHLDFISAVHETIAQSIPIDNPTGMTWRFRVELEGRGWDDGGVKEIEIAPHTTGMYRLNFRPRAPGVYDGILAFVSSGSNSKVGEIIYELSGTAENPKCSGHLTLNCSVGNMANGTFNIPNPTNQKLTFQVTSDIPHLSGPDIVAVLPGHSRAYNFCITALRRGHLNGSIVFTAVENSVLNYDSDGDEIEDPYPDASNDLLGYRVWFTVAMTTTPSVPVTQLQVTTACWEEAQIEVSISNPTQESIVLEATLNGQYIKGPPTVTLEPASTSVYTLSYLPYYVGSADGSVIFYSDKTGEFWYDLVLITELPPPIVLPALKTQMGAWSTTMIKLSNPTDGDIFYTCDISNQLNYQVDFDISRPIRVPRGAGKTKNPLEIPVIFTPSSLESDGQECSIIFASKKYGNRVEYLLTGYGILPEIQDAIFLETTIGSCATANISWKNPFDEMVVLSIQLDKFDQKESPFQLLLRNLENIRVAPRATQSITLAFTPQANKFYETKLILSVKRSSRHGGRTLREDTTQSTFWKVANWTEHYGYHATLDETTGETTIQIPEIFWIFPCHGLPKTFDSDPLELEAPQLTNSYFDVEVGLPGLQNSNQKCEVLKIEEASNSSVPKDVYNKSFYQEIKVSDFKLSQVIDSHLISQEEPIDPLTGIFKLVFRIALKEPLTCGKFKGDLLLKSINGDGYWRFPLKFNITQRVVQDVIKIKSEGIGKTGGVVFTIKTNDTNRLSTQTVSSSNDGSRNNVGENFFEEETFDTQLTPKSSAFKISPQNGKFGAKGEVKFTMTFTPPKYGKAYETTLKIATSKRAAPLMYQVIGVLPPDDSDSRSAVRMSEVKSKIDTTAPDSIRVIENQLRSLKLSALPSIQK